MSLEVNSARAHQSGEMNHDLRALAGSLTRLSSRLRSGAIAPSLSTAAEIRQMPAPASSDSDERRWVEREGLARLAGLSTAVECGCVAHGIESLTDAGFPAVTVFAFDELWRVGHHLADRVSAMMGARFVLMADVWAWRIAQGSGRGWPPHRGVSECLLDRNVPQILNAWIALVDVTTDRSCMHFIPFDDDPGYPNALDRIDAPLACVRALPLAAGDALIWNANVLHWGGPCATRASGPRVSCSFSLCRDGYDPGVPLVDPDQLSLDERIDLIASQIVTYGAGQPDVTREALEWARTMLAFRHLTERLGQ